MKVYIVYAGGNRIDSYEVVSKVADYAYDVKPDSGVTEFGVTIFI